MDGISKLPATGSRSAFLELAYNTFYYVILAVPLGVVVAIALALAMNQKVREVTLYRVLLYLPSVAPVFALSMMLIWLLNPRFGLFNYLLGLLHIPAINWLGDARWSKLAIVLVAQFGAGHIGLIFLTALRAIPPTYMMLRHWTVPVGGGSSGTSPYHC